MKQKITRTEKQTIDYGRTAAKRLTGGDILLLQGELGAGKTTLVKGIAEGLGITDTVVSPTFTLMNVYHLSTPQSGTLEHRSTPTQTLVHIDTYRLKNEQELINIGVEDYLGAPDTICIVEWPEKIERLLKGRKTIQISLKHKTNNEREITLAST